MMSPLLCAWFNPFKFYSLYEAGRLMKKIKYMNQLSFDSNIFLNKMTAGSDHPKFLKNPLASLQTSEIRTVRPLMLISP